MTSNSEKNEKSLAEFIVIVAIIGVMMAIFINFFIKNESKFTQAGFVEIAHTFNTKVNAVHAQWLMDKQPSVVYLASLNRQDKQAIPVNKKGWIDVNQPQLTCETIWLLVMDIPIYDINLSVSAIEVHTNIDNGTNEHYHQISECRYVLPDGSYFQYNRAKGKVSKVFISN